MQAATAAPTSDSEVSTAKLWFCTAGKCGVAAVQQKYTNPACYPNLVTQLNRLSVDPLWSISSELELVVNTKFRRYKYDSHVS